MGVTTEQWQKLKNIFAKATELTGTERQEYVMAACKDNPGLLEEVQSLIEAHDNPGPLDQSLESMKQTALTKIETKNRRGEKIGPYEIIDELGGGGMGSVFLADRADGQYDQKVALKVLRSGFTTRNQLRRFVVERQILASLNHPNIATLMDGGVTEEGQLWFTMEYVNGMPIDRYCKENRLSIEQRLNLFLHVCLAIQFAHRKLVVHRDLKPSNILVREDGTIKLLDFGIAKVLNPGNPGQDPLTITQTGILPLTPAYASPEQIRGDTVTTSSDIYQLGVVLYELLSGIRPYEVSGLTPSEIEHIICEENPILPSTAVTQITVDLKNTRLTGIAHHTDPEQLKKRLRGDLDTIILKAMHKEPDRRYESAEQLASDIKLYLSGHPVTAYPDSRSYRVRKFLNRHRLAVAAASAIIISLLIGISIALWQAGKAEQAAELARIEAEKANRALAESEESLARAESLHDFLINLFWAADIDRDQDQMPGTEDLLKHGARQALDGQNIAPSERIGMMLTIGEIYLRQLQHDEAKPLVEAAIALGHQNIDTWPQDLARALFLQSDIYRLNGNIQQAKELLLEAESMIEGMEQHWEVFADIRSSRSYLERLQYNYEEAIQLIEPLYGELQARDDVDPELKTRILNYLAGYYMDTGQLREADAMREEVTGMLRDLHGDTSRNYAISLTNSISLKYNLGEFGEAESRAEEAISIFNRIYDAPTGVESVAYGALAYTQLFAGRFDEAFTTLELTNEKWAQTLGIITDQWQVPDLYRGMVFSYMRRWPEAVDHLQKSRDAFDDGHHTMMISPPEALLATGLCYLERPREGHAILETLESINDNTMVNNPSHLAQIYEAKAICSYREGFPERALEQINLSLQVMTYPGRAAERSERKRLKAKILAELGQTAAAVHELQKAELLFMDIEMADHPLSLKTKNTIPALN